MPFIIQGKTNLKYILITVLLAAIVGGGILAWQYLLAPKEEPQMPEVKTPEVKAPEETMQPKFSFLNKALLFGRDYADPSVIRLDNGTYLMYLNHRDEEGRSGSLVLSSSNGLSWKQETDILFPGVAVGRAFKFPNGVRYYYHQPERKPNYPFEPVPSNIVSSFSPNGLTGWKEEGIRLKSREGYVVTGPTVVKLKDGKYRMVFDEVKLAKPDKQSVIEGIIYSASSSNGLTWVRDDEPTIVYENNIEGVELSRPQPPQVLHPFVIEWPEENGHLMFYNSHSRIFAAFSSDGFNWNKLGYTGILGADVDAIHLPDGTFRIYYGGGCPKDTRELACIDPKTREYITVPSTIHTGILKIEIEKEKSIQQPTLPLSTREESEQRLGF